MGNGVDTREEREKEHLVIGAGSVDGDSCGRLLVFN